MNRYFLNLNRIVFISILLFQATLCFAKPITKTESLKIARQFYQENVIKKDNNLKSASALEFKLDYISTNSEATLKSASVINDTAAYYYIYNVGNDQGFVIVSGDDRTTPVLGYSNEGEFTYENMPAHVKEFMDNYKKQVQLIIQSNDSHAFNSTETFQSTSSVAPLIKTKWGQSSPYNSKIPNQYLAGCIATSMAQVMNYHKWPKQKFGSNTTYDWDNMLNSYSSSDDTSSVSCRAVASLMYDCGVAVSMNYSYTSSTAYSDKIPGALVGPFGYDAEVVNVPHGNCSESYWKDLIVSELNAGRPVILGGFSAEGGHSYVGDGYDENRLIHINWGWDGYNDGYFEISSLSTTPNNISFYSGQNMVIGIKKFVKNSKYSLFYYDFSTTKGFGIPFPKNTPVTESFYSIECSGDRFVGKVGIALYQNNTQLLVFDSAQVNINESRQDRNQWVRTELNMKFNDSISNGTYQLKPVYKSEDDSTWSTSVFYSPAKNSQYIEVVITDTQLVFFANSKTIKCQAPGELAANISKKDRNDLYRLVVSGTIGNQDIQFIKDNLANIRTLDLKNVYIDKTTGVDGDFKAQEIGKEAFAYSNIPYIELPSKLRSIGNSAFSYSKLIKISIPSTITVLNEDLFGNCYYLTDVSLPDSLKSIRSGAFNRCSSLQSIELPSQVDSIYGGVFIYCTSLTQILSYNVKPPIIVGTPFQYVPVTIPVHVPLGCKTLYKSANGWKNFTNIIADLPAKIKKIVYNPIAGKLSTHFTPEEKATINNLTISGNLKTSDFTFMRDSLLALTYTNISEVKLPDDKIPDKAFYRELPASILLNKIVFPKSLIAIGDSAFKNCNNLADVSFPNYLSKIGTGAFDGCSKITQFKLDGGPSVYQVEDGVVFNSAMTSLILYPNGKSEKTFTFKWSVTSIGNSAFCECPNLEAVAFSDNLTSIGDYAFNGCKSLKVLAFPAKITNIGEGAFNNCSSITTITSDNNNPPKIGGSLTFKGISKDINVKVPLGTVNKYKEAFGWKEFLNINDNPLTKTVSNNIAGNLSTRLTEDEKISIVKLIITGELNADDLSFAQNSLVKLTILDISETNFKTDGSYLFLTGWSNLTSLMLPSSLTSIGAGAFRWCSKLTTINIPSLVTSIGENAFYGCSDLTSVTLPSSVTSIGANAFKECISLATINIPVSVTSIGENAFYGCKGLTSFIIPSGITSIAGSTFYNCSGLTSLTIPSSVNTIGESAFYGCSGLGSLAIPSSIQLIEDNTFRDCGGLTSLNIPSSVTSIGDYAFSWCDGLTSLTIPSSVTSIGEYAFNNCRGLTSLTIPSSVTSIAEGVFSGCSGVTSMTIPSSVTSIGGNAFNNSGLKTLKVINPVPIDLSASSGAFNTLDKNPCYLNVPAGSKVAYQNSAQWKDFKCIIEGDYSTTKTINLSAGHLLSELTSTEFYTINNLTLTGKIDARDFVVLRDSMYNLSVLDLSGVEIVAYTGTDGPAGSTLTTYNANKIPQNAFYNYNPYKVKPSLTSITLPSSITSIGNESFSGSGLTSITLPPSISTIGYRSFSNCRKLTSINIPSSVTSIPYGAFEYCTGLNSISIPSSITSIAGYAFSSCTGLTSITIPSTVTSIGEEAFGYCKAFIDVEKENPNYSSTEGVLFDKNKTILIYCPTSLTGNYSIPSTVKIIGNYAFRQCIDVISITIPSSTTSIGEGAFSNCQGLTSVLIPSSVTSIGNYAFYRCNLTSLIIPTSVTSIGNFAFAYCSNLTSVYANTAIPLDLSSSTYVFSSVNGVYSGKCTLHVPIGCKSAYQAANQWKDFVNIADDLLPLEISIETNSILVPKEGSTTTVVITSNTQWIAYSDQTWLAVNPNTVTTGNGTVTLTVQANSTISTRTAWVIVSGAGITSQTITVTQEAGIEAGVIVLQNEKIKIYPNPVTDGFYIDGIEGTAKLVLFDLNGKVQFTKVVVDHENISISLLTEGVYLAMITSGKGLIVKKLVKR